MRMLVVGAATALLLSACGGDSDGDSAEPRGGGASQSTTPARGGGEHDMHGGETATCSPTGTSLAVVASNTKFDKSCLAAPAGQPFTLSYENKDSIAHNIVILESHAATDVFFQAEIFSGPKPITHQVGALKADTFAFHCEVHPSQMKGTFVSK